MIGFFVCFFFSKAQSQLNPNYSPAVKLSSALACITQTLPTDETISACQFKYWSGRSRGAALMHYRQNVLVQAKCVRCLKHCSWNITATIVGHYYSFFLIHTMN
jgi:hypothetical protein